jgi:hypothetical protein
MIPPGPNAIKLSASVIYAIYERLSVAGLSSLVQCLPVWS